MTDAMRAELLQMMALDVVLDDWAIPDETRTDRGDEMARETPDELPDIEFAGSSLDRTDEQRDEIAEPEPEPPPVGDYEPRPDLPKDAYPDLGIIPQPDDGPYGQQL